MSKPIVLIVDDNAITRRSIAAVLGNAFEARHAASGEECLTLCAERPPELILLDIEMDGIDGFETCRRLRQHTDLPVIFVSSHDTLEERVLGFDCGGDDFIVKPYDPALLVRKVRLSIEQTAIRKRLSAEKAKLEQKASDYERNITDTGLLLQFMRESLLCTEYEDLALKLLSTTASYGVHCHVQLRHPDGCFTLTPDGPASPLEASVLERSLAMGRVFQFSRRLVINYDCISLLALDMPAGEAAALNIRHNLSVLAESAEVVAETIGVRKESARRAETLQSSSLGAYEAIEQLRAMYRTQQTDVRFCLSTLIHEIEKTYVFLGLSNNQEDTVSTTLRNGAETILGLLDQGTALETQFQLLLDTMRPEQNQASNELWL